MYATPALGAVPRKHRHSCRRLHARSRVTTSNHPSTSMKALDVALSALTLGELCCSLNYGCLPSLDAPASSSSVALDYADKQPSSNDALVALVHSCPLTSIEVQSPEIPSALAFLQSPSGCWRGGDDSQLPASACRGCGSWRFRGVVLAAHANACLCSAFGPRTFSVVRAKYWKMMTRTSSSALIRMRCHVAPLTSPSSRLEGSCG